MSQDLTRLFLLVSMCALLIACGKAKTPQEVAHSFWQAVESGNPSQVKKHVSAKDQITMDSLQNVMPISDISFGKIIIDGDIASVDTLVTLEGDRPMELPINTHLLKENDQWAVDYVRTIDTIVGAGKVAAVINQFKDIGNAVKNGIEQSVNELEKAMPNIEEQMSNLEEQIQLAVPQLKSRFENFSRELEQALNAPIPNTDNLEERGEITDPSADLPPGNGGGIAQSPMPKLNKELENIQQEILKAVPELKEQIHGFVEQLQEALELPPAEPNQREQISSEPIKI